MDIKDLRNRIDCADDALMQAYIERTKLVNDIAEYKKRHNLPILNADREQQVYDRIVAKFGEEYSRDIYSLYSGIINISKLRQAAQNRTTSIEELVGLSESKNIGSRKERTVAIQGAEGAFSMIAAKEMFTQPQLQYKKSFSEVFEAVSSGQAEFGVVPIENSNAGSVNEVYDLLARYGLYIAKARVQKIEHCLVGIKGAQADSIKNVISHPQALYQCKEYLRKRNITATNRANTALAAEEVSKLQDMSLAAIASEETAALYGLSILEKGVSDERNNNTRFIAITKDNLAVPTANKISLVVTLAHKEGSLAQLLNIIASYRVNLTKLESRPISGSNFEFMFYFDIEGNIKDRVVQDMLFDIYEYCEKVLYLGGYTEQ
jgi:chorismate mutase/prephenate dehydratase